MKQILPIRRGYCLSNIKRHLFYILLVNIVIVWLIPNTARAQTPIADSLRRLQDTVLQLDQVQVVGYGKISKRFNTGSVVTVTSEEIERQPVSNPLAALAGRVPGMTVTPTSGDPGAKVNIQIRGQNSIAQGSQPLFIIDGVPFSNDYPGTGAIVMTNGGQSPFNTIVPGDIAQIDVLKDADATAIYGSRGANGVILITTKKGKEGKTTFNGNVYQGLGQITRRMDLLNTQQYVAMRKEAYANDGITITPINAPDVVLWDTTRYTDWQDEFIGGTAHFTNVNASLSGGNALTQFLVSGNYNRQSTVYPGHFADNRAAGRANMTHTTKDGRLYILVSSSYSSDKNALPSDLTSYINLAPNTPVLLDGDGNLVWSENGGTFSNPLSALFRSATAATDNFISNLNVQFEIIKGLYVRTTAGYNLVQFNESYFVPKASLDPNGSTPVSSSKFANTASKSWIIEPQLEYGHTWGKGKLTALVGSTIQQDNRRLYTIEASGFPSDALIAASSFAQKVNAATSLIEYRYQAVFGRINYDHAGKYLLDVTARRDGSSRFGPDRRVANFGAIGGAWIFSEELKALEGLKWLSFGKLRASYGITGNDQIGDYQYLDNYQSMSIAYQDQVGYIPSRLYNPDYTWEKNRKLEAALEAGLFGNRLMITANWFRNRSNNQLLKYKLPDQVGFPSILSNFNALVQNTGWELSITGSVIKKQQVTWTINANITRAMNKLLAFPDLEASSYANTLEIGKPLSIAKYLNATGVDPETGIYTFSGTSRPADQTVIADFTPAYYGGISNTVTYKRWYLDFLFQFTKQKGVNYLADLGKFAPGTRYNQPVAVLDRWQQPGDLAEIQRFTTTGAGTAAYNNYAGYSNGRITDASYLRLKNVYLSYDLNFLKVFFQGSNLFTITQYKGLDPETGGAKLPPIAIYSFGIQTSF